MDNIILMTDSYKVSHWKQYPEGIEHVYSYLEARKGAQYDKIVFFGLQYYLYRYLGSVVVDQQKIDYAEQFFIKHFGNADIFNKKGWEYIAKEHHGRLPVVIHALPEGSVVEPGTVLMTIENTDPECFWLTSYLETLLMKIWYPCTVASKSRRMKEWIKYYLDKTGDDPADFKLHDFGYRGSTSEEAAALGDAAHLVNFMGSDTLAGIELLRKYYDADMSAYSIPAAEHSTITSYGKENETYAYHNMLAQFPTGLVAVVSDSYDIYNACEKIWGEELHDMVESREGTLVIRPDSGDPCIVLPKVLDILGNKFGYTKNSKGYKVLPKYLRIIQGDGVTEKTLTQILVTLQTMGWSADNLAFGSGGGLLQDVDRDTCRFAMKASNITIKGVDYPIAKDPVTDPTKTSQKGRFEGLTEVFRDGLVTMQYSFDEIRERAKV